MIRAIALHLLLAACGAASVFAYAPVDWMPLLPLSLAALFFAVETAPTKRRAALAAFAWGLGYFTGNVHWIFISLHNFGGMPVWMAAGCVLLFSAYLALFPALAAWLARRLPCPPRWRLGLLLPTVYIATEWLRGWLFTGFPWAVIGNSQTVALAGFFPLLGVYGAGWLAALATAQWLVHWKRGLIFTAALGVIGFGLQQIAWTTPAGRPVTVSIPQGNIRQDEKWDSALYINALRINLGQVAQARGEVIVLPETAIPSLYQDTPTEYVTRLQDSVHGKKAALLMGFALYGNSPDVYYNGAMNLDTPTQFYAKAHLVPFGEYVPVPWLFGWMYRYLNMPLSGFTPGKEQQVPLQAGPLRVAANICYEDAFGDELRRNSGDADVMANFSNMAWFDGSWAAEQQAQMSAARALENGRWMLRATNTGVTAVIDQRGRRVAELAPRTRAVLETTVQGRRGYTPYMRWGNWPVLLAMLATVLGCAWRSRRRS
ncbi:apolipoprotein N-acyltransferase [Andreprevotia lacus DSM 23236]|uniref:Apolipoprotein N-acyltransferase n=1 Tax=Andreprevotia lacus DSM 23236 TaxID=1121001 RepID=A0A1W1X169_9NEIS|nr:apolipoprotein N-acyltransferase [Andreprevotia lacus]SMC17647.1 apolipoprotein N-acyltransferase [Andreprevotia lacus DSM 23236]